MKAAGAILDAQLEQCAIIGTKDTRMTALTLQSTLENLLFSAERYEAYVSALSADPDQGPRLLAEIAADKRRRLGSSEPVPSKSEYIAVGKLAAEFSEPDDWFLEHSEEWRAAARSELGVPN
jgi:hypothetical protein